MTQFMDPEASELSVLRDILRVYDHRFLDLGPEQRRRLVEGTRQVLGDGLPATARAALPAAYRLRAFCIQRGLQAELERLIREETAGQTAGAVVVGGRVYAMYPYLRGVPRHDADITEEVGAEHRLDGLCWTGERLSVRGHATIAQVQARQFTVELALRHRMDQAEYRVATLPHDGGFEAIIEPAGLAPGHWDVHAVVHALGVTREAPFGQVRDPKLRPPRERDGIVAYFTEPGTLALQLPPAPRHPNLLRRLLRR